VVFWWELHLTEDIVLCTGPFENYSLHWKQAVQYIPVRGPLEYPCFSSPVYMWCCFQEVRVSAGVKLPLVGFHNTFGLNFAVHPDRATLREGLTGLLFLFFSRTKAEMGFFLLS